MKTFRHILCPVDFSASSHRAFAYALMVCRYYQAELHVIHTLMPFQDASLATPSLVQSLRDGAMIQLKRLEESARQAHVTCHLLLTEGYPDHRIQEAATSTQADVVVMGTHGRRGFRRWLLGSVTERLLRQLSLPILTIAPAESQKPATPAIKKVLVTTDFSQGTEEAMAYAFSVAQEFEASVTLLHVIPRLPDTDDPQLQRQREVDRSRLMEESAHLLNGLIPEEAKAWCEVSVEIDLGQPYERIMSSVEEKHIDLLVMNIHGKSLMERALMGSTAERVIRGAPCPVLAVPPQPTPPTA